MASEMRQPADQFLRALDFAAELNEREALYQERVREILLRFLAVKDSIEALLAERSASAQPLSQEAEAIFKRVVLFNRQLELAFNQSGVVAIPCMGQAVDPTIHRVVRVEEQSGIKPNSIIQEQVKGYYYQNKLLRPSEVVVAKSADYDVTGAEA
jgi:molecular chaperone GrpE